MGLRSRTSNSVDPAGLSQQLALWREPTLRQRGSWCLSPSRTWSTAASPRGIWAAMEGTCKFNASNVGATIKSWTDVGSGSEPDLQKAVATVGPVSVAIDASQYTFQLYSSGIYHDDNCSSQFLDHGVLAVGYGSVKTGAIKDYWLAKNSWGTDWGMKGYIKMSRNNNNNCGIATSASYPVA